MQATLGQRDRPVDPLREGLVRIAQRIDGVGCVTNVIGGATVPIDAMRRPGQGGFEAFSTEVASAYFPHQLAVRRESGAAPDLRAVDLGDVRLARIGWGAEVSVVSDHPGAWAVNVPKCGVLEAKVHGHHVLSTNGQATICPPDTPTRMTRWSADCAIVGFRVDRAYLEREALALVGRPARLLPEQLDLRGPSAAAWLSLLNSIGVEALRNPQVTGHESVRRRLGAALVAAFVVACFPTDPEAGTLRPRIVSQVLDAMEADPAAAWSAAELSRCAGVGIRRVQQGFRDYLGATPHEVLTGIRLERVHADLLAGEVHVADVAYRWGFTHLGRFAATYKAKYGVTPSQTLYR